MINFRTIAGLKSKEELEFIKLSTEWRIGKQYVLDDCLFYNFGYQGELPFPMISLNLHSNIFGIDELETPTGCSFVIIAGKYVQKINVVMKKVDNISDAVHHVPLASLIFGDNVDIDSSQRLTKKFISHSNTTV